jgi:hypothetical protein
MPLVNRLSLLVILSSLAVLAACGGGGGSHINPTPPPSGGFSPSSLSGTYVFSTAGADTNGNFLTMVGTLNANGSGGITGGVVDIDDSGFSIPVVKGVAITGGRYSLTPDGRGQVRLSAKTPFGNSIGLDFVLVSSSHGAVTEFDGNGTGSGALDLQSSVTQAQLAGSYAFSFSGIDTSGSPLATVGSVTLDSSGNISAGIQDFNDSNAFTSLTPSGSVTPGSAGAPGTATLTTTGILGALTFDVYPVDSTHLKFIQTGGSTLLSGDAFTQKGASLPTTPTTFAFVMSGAVVSNGALAPLAVGGLMPIDGVSAITGGTVDVNDNGNAALGQSFNGSYAALGSGGRTAFTVSGFSVATQFVGYPTASAGLQMLESDGVGFLAGVAFAQSSPVPSLQASQGYGMNLSAANLSAGVEEDDIAEFTTTSSGFSGQIDINDSGSNQISGQRYSGTYTLDSPATGRGEFTSTQYNSGIFYAVDSSTLLFLDAGDNIGLVGTGIFELQNAGAQPALASQHAMVLPRPLPHGNRRQGNK